MKIRAGQDNTFNSLRKSCKVAAIILAAGKGTRMKSSIPKVLHNLLGRPMLHRVMDVTCDVKCDPTVVITGHGSESVQTALVDYKCISVKQSEQKGTGHAVMCAKAALVDYKGPVLIMCGDSPLVRSETLKELVKRHVEEVNDLSILSAIFENPSGYGRIVRDEESSVAKIVEEKDADEKHKIINEINTGVYAVDSEKLFEFLEDIDTSNSQSEYYLTDIVSIAAKGKYKINAYPLGSQDEGLGVNSRSDLAIVEKIMLKEIRKKFMEHGVTFHMPSTVYIEPEVKICEDVVIGPFCVIKGKSILGKGSIIGPYTLIDNYKVEQNSEIPPMSKLM